MVGSRRVSITSGKVWVSKYSIPGLRFAKHKEDLAFDLHMTPGSSLEEIQERLLQAAHDLTHVQEADPSQR